MVQEGLGHHIGHRSPGSHPPATQPYPLELEELVKRSPADTHAANFLDLRPGRRLVIGNDRQRLDRGTAQPAGLNGFLRHQETEIGRCPDGPAIT